MIKKIKLNKITECSLFQSGKGLSELHLIIKPESDDMKTCLKKIKSSYNEICKKFNINDNSLVFSRVYCKKINSHKELLLKSDIYKIISKVSYSIIEQQPLYGGEISLYLYYIYDKNGLSKTRINRFSSNGSGNGTMVSTQNYDLLFLGNVKGTGMNTYDQTLSLFERYSGVLKENHQKFNENFIRSWIFVSDIDNNYKDMVEARKQYFFDNGITTKSIFPASTGIGCNPIDSEKITADFISLKRAKPEQIVRMEIPANMPSPYTYGVTFERGLKIIFGDRVHMHISGTASIDKNGGILYQNDIIKQTKRTIENIKALLKSYDAGLEDIAYFNVYLRESGMAPKVKKILDKELPKNTPYLMVNGPVCRPGWLIEIDGISIKSVDSSFPPFE